MTSEHNSPSQHQLTRRVGWIPPGGATACHLPPQPAQRPGTSGLGLGAGSGVVGGGCGVVGGGCGVVGGGCRVRGGG